MTVYTVLPVDASISAGGSITLHVTSGKVNILLSKVQNTNGHETLVPLLANTYAAKSTGYSNTLITETGVHRWRVTVTAVDLLSAMELTTP